eukprot:7563201-Pyramimonas_sp.AAC.1
MSAANIREGDEALTDVAMLEKGMMKLKAIIAKPFPYSEMGQGRAPALISFDMRLLSQETPVRPVMRPNFIVPGPAIEGPAKLSASESGLPINMKLTGNNEDAGYVNYHPFSRGGPARPPAAKPSGGAGQDKDGDGGSDAP